MRGGRGFGSFVELRGLFLPCAGERQLLCLRDSEFGFLFRIELIRIDRIDQLLRTIAIAERNRDARLEQCHFRIAALVGATRKNLRRLFGRCGRIRVAAFQKIEFRQRHLRDGGLLRQLMAFGVIERIDEILARLRELAACDVEQTDTLLDVQDTVVIAEFLVLLHRLLPVHRGVVEIAHAIGSKTDVVETFRERGGIVELLTQPVCLSIVFERFGEIARLFGDDAAIVVQVGDARSIAQ